MDKEGVKAWMAGYIQAWNSNDAQEIGQLFSEEARYYTGPFAEPWQGRQAIVDAWIARKDEPGSFRFRYEILSASGGLGIVRGWTQYLNPEKEYSNIWVMRFDEQGRCSEFIEWWVKRKTSA